MHSTRLLSGAYRRIVWVSFKNSNRGYAKHSLAPSHVSSKTAFHKPNNEIDPSEFAPKQAVLLKKITRYEYEKQINVIEGEEELTNYLSQKGSDYLGLLKRHDEYYAALDAIYESLEKHGITTKIVNRMDYDEALINNADIVLSAGGDGTFLLAASRVHSCNKPIIGFNTDPIRSEGYLCLPKTFSGNYDKAMDKILAGKFSWGFRQRIRLTMAGQHENDEPIHMHDQEMGSPEFRFHEHVQENEQVYSNNKSNLPPRVLPSLALNDVFIGESISARVSYYEISVNDSPRVKQKSSGITVCTGTGSSSWFFHINHIPKQSVKEILRIANRLGGTKVNLNDEMLLRKVTKAFNCSLRFDPSELRMAYVIRDPVVNGVFQVASPRGFANKMELKSRMWDARIVIDGGYSYKFNDGAVVELEMHPEDALRTILLE